MKFYVRYRIVTEECDSVDITDVVVVIGNKWFKLFPHETIPFGLSLFVDAICEIALVGGMEVVRTVDDGQAIIVEVDLSRIIEKHFPLIGVGGGD